MNDPDLWKIAVIGLSGFALGAAGILLFDKSLSDLVLCPEDDETHNAIPDNHENHELERENHPANARL